ncbi:MAG: hypothetical protein JWQ45_2303 [Blastococcus sp.]|nr:hypothetical protein [Blastococcus sp.]
MRILGLAVGPRIRCLGIVTAAALVISGTSVGGAAADDTPADPAAEQSVANSTQAPGVAVPDALLEGASSDEEAISAAAASFDASEPGSAVELTQAASAADEVALQATSVGLEGSDAAGGELVLTGEGATLALDGESYGLAPLGGSGESSVVDGALVLHEVAPSTDVVTRAVEGGVQMAAVLADAAAPDRVAFGLDLPRGAELTENADGTISVIAPVEAVEPLPGEEARIDTEVSAILGDPEDDVDITDAQWAALDAVEPAATTTTVESRVVATMGAAWAVDANGETVGTHYEIDGTTLTQVVETSAETAYPVVADPAWYWWVWTGASCAANLATFVFAAAKLINLAAKLSSIARKSAALTSLVSKLGGSQNLIRKIYYLAKGWAEGNVMKYLTRSEYLALTGASSAALSLLGDALGIGSCVSLIRAL